MELTSNYQKYTSKIKHLKSWLNFHSLKLAMIIAIIASFTSFIFYYSKGLHLAYNDATAHLNISRRIVDSLTPGFVQIGSVWLPLLHLLELPFVWNYFMWQSGLAGSIVSMSGFILSCYFIFRFLEIITKDRISALIGVLIFIANANMLYMQTTAMFEPLMITILLGTVYFLLKWVTKGEIFNLIMASFFTMLGTLTRYDGWFAFLVSSVFVFAYSLLNKKLKSAEGLTFLFVTLGAFGIILWFLYNTVIFGNPFYFAFNEYSAFSQQLILESKGNLPTKKNFMLSLLTYSVASVLNQGIIFSALAVLGLLFYIIKNRLNPKSWVVYILLSPFVFNVSTLYKGHSVIWIPNLPPYLETFFNARYGLLMLPAVVIFIGYLTKKNLIMKLVVIIAIIFQSIFFYSLLPTRNNHLSFVTLRDTIASINEPTREAVKWLSQNYDGGLILISSASSESFIFYSGLELKNFITEGTGNYWKEALIRPTKHAKWIVLFPSFTDRVGKALKRNPSLKKDYDIVYENKAYLIFKVRRPAISTTPISNPLTLWKIQSIDTMKTSRDQARQFLTDPESTKKIYSELKAIKSTGANYVAIDTPYDEEFLPVLRTWVKKAHELGLKVWFRGNFSSWEGWFGYPKNMTPDQHLNKTAEFISKNTDLFADDDSFLAAPEAENGGPWAPLTKNNFEAYRSFIKNQYDVCKVEFAKLKKKVFCNWFSMNADVANNVLDKETVDYIGGLVTIDHYSRNREHMNEFLEKLHKKFNASILIGEFGAPIPEFNGKMTEEEQADFIADILDLIKQKKYVVGINYWTNMDSSSSIFNWDLSPRLAATTIEDFYKPALLTGIVLDYQRKPIQNVRVLCDSSVANTDIDGNFSIFLPAGRRFVSIMKGNNKLHSFTVFLRNGEIVKYNPIIPNNKPKDVKVVNPEEYLLLNWFAHFFKNLKLSIKIKL